MGKSRFIELSQQSQPLLPPRNKADQIRTFINPGKTDKNYLYDEELNTYYIIALHSYTYQKERCQFSSVGDENMQSDLAHMFYLKKKKKMLVIILGTSG